MDNHPLNDKSIFVLSSIDESPNADNIHSPKLKCTNESLDEIISSVGSFRRVIQNPETFTQSLKNDDSSSSNEYFKILESNIKRRKVRFNEDSLSIAYVDQQRWKTENFSTIEEIISKYSTTCVELKIRPSNQILDQLTCMDSIFDPLDELYLRGIRLDSKHLDAIDDVFRHVRCNTINASKCCLEDDTFISICEMIEYYQSTRVIVFAHNPKIKIRGWIHLGRMMRKTISVEQLDIGYCAIDNFSLPMFLRCIRADCLLRVLHLEGNGLSGKGLMILLAALKFNTNLKELYLGRNNLNPDDSLHIASILKNNPLLEVVDLRDNAIQDRGLKHIAISLIEQADLTSMNSIFLTNNNISDGGMDDVSAILLSLTSIKTLSLSGNNIGNSGVQFLKQALLTNSSLSKFGLRNSKITCEGAIAIAEVLAESRSLEVVDLRGNDIRIAGLMALGLAHKVNHFLLNLQIPENIKADQRDRQLIIDVLNDLLNYRNRNHTQREAIYIARSLEESLNANEVGDIQSVSSCRDTFVDHTFSSRNSSLEVDNELLLDAQFDSSVSMRNHFLHGSLKLYEGTVLSSDPDALTNLSSSDDINSELKHLLENDPNLASETTGGKFESEVKKLPDLLEEIPIGRSDCFDHELENQCDIQQPKTLTPDFHNSGGNRFDLIDSTQESTP